VGLAGAAGAGLLCAPGVTLAGAALESTDGAPDCEAADCRGNAAAHTNAESVSATNTRLRKCPTTVFMIMLCKMPMESISSANYR
jgi:hypothetical protein